MGGGLERMVETLEADGMEDAGWRVQHPGGQRMWQSWRVCKRKQ